MSNGWRLHQKPYVTREEREAHFKYDDQQLGSLSYVLSADAA
jgi:hypothetical protein